MFSILSTVHRSIVQFGTCHLIIMSIIYSLQKMQETTGYFSQNYDIITKFIILH